jgi:UDP-2,3-diacylglucosamine hydrolase
MKAVFLSDTHLKGAADPAYLRLMRFFEGLRGRDTAGSRTASEEQLTVDHLVIAGDFFDFWFEREGRVYPGFQPIIDRLTALRDEGIRISLCEGNHDFFLGDFFSRRLGIDVYPEWAEFSIDGLRVLAAHGDTVDLGNRKYLVLRRFLRSAFARGLQRNLPLPLLWRVARLASQTSKGMSAQSVERLAGVLHGFARGKFREGYDAVILGHCHKPLLRQEMSGGRQRTSVTLGDWIEHDSYLRCDDGRFSLMRFSSER